MAWTRTKTTRGDPRPFTIEERALIKGGQASFQFFLMYVYPRSFAGKKFRMADALHHEFSLGQIHFVWAKMVEENSRVCVLAPRAHLKSTVLNHGFAFWKLFRANQDVDGIVMSFKDTLAQEHTSKLKKAIMANDLCRFWVDNKTTAESVVDFTCGFGDGNPPHE